MRRSRVFWFLAISLLVLFANLPAASALSDDFCPPSSSKACTGCYESTITALNFDCTFTASKQYDSGCGSLCEITSPPVTCTPAEASSCTGCYEKSITKTSTDCSVSKVKVQDFSCSSQCELDVAPPVSCTPAETSSCTGCYEKTTTSTNSTARKA